MGKASKARFANGIVSALLICFFIVHGVLGMLAMAGIVETSLSWLAWVGVVLVVVHVLIGIATSYEQLADKERPPSSRKKQHLALKWATGVLLVAAVCIHISLAQMEGASALVVGVSGLASLLCLIGVLAWHVWVGSKSLLTDLNLDKGRQTAVRIAACLVAVVFAIAVIVIGLM